MCFKPKHLLTTLTCSWKYLIFRAISSHRFTCIVIQCQCFRHPVTRPLMWQPSMTMHATIFNCLKTNLVGVGALEGTLVSIEILELQQAHFTQGTDGVVC